MKSLAQLRQEQMRRAMLDVLNDAGAPLNALTVRTVMDGLNHSTTWQTFLNCIGYLAGEGLLCVFPITCSTGELTIFDQEKYLDLMHQANYDSPEARQMMLRLRQDGRRFLEGNQAGVKGVA